MRIPGHQVEGDTAQQPGPQLIDGRLEQCAGAGGVAGLEMVLGRADSARRLVPAEPDCQLDQFGRGRGGAASARDVGGGVERFERFGVCARRRQSHVPGLQLGQDHGFGQEPVRSPALGGTGICVDAARQQRMGEPHAIAVNRDDALGFVPRQAAPQLVRRGAGDLREQLHGRIRRRRGGQQDVADCPSRLPIRRRISSASVPGSDGWALAEPM